MTKYEYVFVPLTETDSQDRLNQLGLEGWRLTQVLPDMKFFDAQAILEREVKKSSRSVGF